MIKLATACFAAMVFGFVVPAAAQEPTSQEKPLLHLVQTIQQAASILIYETIQ